MIHRKMTKQDLLAIRDWAVASNGVCSKFPFSVAYKEYFKRLQFVKTMKYKRLEVEVQKVVDWVEYHLIALEVKDKAAEHLIPEKTFWIYADKNKTRIIQMHKNGDLSEMFDFFAADRRKVVQVMEIEGGYALYGKNGFRKVYPKGSEQEILRQISDIINAKTQERKQNEIPTNTACTVVSQ